MILFDKSAVTLEYRNFAVDTEVKASESYATKFWLDVKCMKYPTADHRHTNLATLAMHVLSVLSNNTNSKRVFSLVRRVKTEFRSSLQPRPASAL